MVQTHLFLEHVIFLLLLMTSLGALECILGSISQIVGISYLNLLINMVETQFSSKVKIVGSDNGPTFKIKSFYYVKGIIHQTSCINTPQKNGVAEGKHRNCSLLHVHSFFRPNFLKTFGGCYAHS